MALILNNLIVEMTITTDILKEKILVGEVQYH